MKPPRNPRMPALARVLALAGAVLAAAAHAQKNDTLESGQEKGYPWIAHSSLDAFYLSSPATPGGVQPYQISAYQGFTIQSLSFASFHMGLRSRETLAPGFNSPYREPFSLKLAGTAEILRDYVYASLGGNIPILPGAIDIADTLALYQALNDYNPLPYSAFLSPRALEVGLFGRYNWTTWSALGGVTYARPARFTAIADHAFYPAPFFDFMARAVLETGKSRHRWDAKATLYGQETNDQRIPAHGEGDLWQLRYEYLRSRVRVGYQAGLGVAVRLPDANRKLKLRSTLEPTATDDNIQRIYGELALAWTPQPDILWRVHLLPKALFTVDGKASGYETETGLSMGLKIWEVHRVRATGTFIFGQFADQTYLGLGVRGEFAFRHLGFQDLEDAGDSGGREP